MIPKITRKLVASTGGVLIINFFVMITRTSSLCFVENFQFSANKCHLVICRQWKFKLFKMAERSDGYSGKTLLTPLQGRRGCREKSLNTITGEVFNKVLALHVQ